MGVRGGFVRPAHPMEIDALVPRLRAGDLAEILASVDMDPLTALQMSADYSFDLRAWVLDGEVAAIGGLCDDSGVIIPWLVGTDATFTTGKWAFARLSRPEMARWNRIAPVLAGHVHAANTAHVRWLGWCGFILAPPIPYGAKGELFHPFERRS